MELLIPLDPNQLKYEKIRKIVKKELKKYDIKPLTDIWVIPHYPRGWEAVFGSGIQRVYILKGIKNKVVDLDIQHLIGFRKNGTLIY